MASYRYRAELPARELGASINDPSATVLIFSKPTKNELLLAIDAHTSGRVVIADFCDDHFATHPHYLDFLSMADHITCPTESMRLIILGYGRAAHVIEDAYLLDEQEPHCNGVKSFWFGHGSNFHTIERVLPTLDGIPILMMSNLPGTFPWSEAALLEKLTESDIVVLPATVPYKSPNRALEAIRAGCFLVAEQHPSLEGFPVWRGDIREGIEWARGYPAQANEMTLQAQDFIRERFSPRTQASAWRALLGLACTSGAESYAGRNGPTSTSTRAT